MGKSSPSPPPAPDYAGAAREQGVANVETARLQGRINNPNVSGPLGGQTVTWGSPTFDQSGYDSAMAAYQAKPRGNAPYERQFTTQDEDGSRFDETGYQNAMNSYMSGNIAPTRDQFTSNANSDQATITQTLTPQAQATLEAQQRVQRSLANLGEQGIGTARTALANPFSPNSQGLQLRIDTSNLARMPVNAGTTGQEAIMSRLAPQLERSDRATQQRLANQGLVPGGEAYENAMISENQRKNDLLTQAVVQGIGLDTNTRAQGFNEASSQMSAQNAAQQAELQREAFLRQQPLNEITGLMSGSQIQMPQFQGYAPTSIAPAPVMQGAMAQGQSAMDQYGIQSANANAQNAGLFGLAGTAGGLAGRMYTGGFFG
tara:strand:- start:676 stop:1797 length:1122 start_codon:yes stop_codon:yes gene_type:complete